MIPGRRLDARTMPSRDIAIAQFFEIASEGIFIGWLDRASPEAAGTVVAANPCLRGILGHGAEVDEHAVLLFDPSRFSDSAARTRLIDQLIADGGVTDYLVQLQRVDGARIWVEITARADVQDDGLVRIDALVRDVSGRRQLDDRARTLYQQLAQSEQLAAIGRTLADVAHELRNPLSTIVAWAERLAQHTTDEKTRKGVDDILSASERAARIVRNALHSSTRRESTRSLVDINAVVEETLGLRQHEQRALNVLATAELAADLPRVFADAHQIQQVLLNVIINAEQAMAAAHNRGTLRVRTAADRQRRVAIVEICDDGPGVPEPVRSRIFDPFFTTKQAGSGTGLGLAVAQALAHEHGGSIRLAQDRTEGATFVIELPAHDHPAA